MQKRQSKISFSGRHWSCMASRFFQAAVTGQLLTCIPLVPQYKEPCSLPSEDRYNNGVDQMPYDTHTLSRDNLRAFIKPETKKYIPTQVLRALYLSIRSSPSPMLLRLSGSRKTACTRLPFPIITFFFHPQLPSSDVYHR